MCQLRCPACPRARGETRESLGNGYLRAEDYRRLLRANPWVNRVELSNWGEAMLSPDLVDVLDTSRKMGVHILLRGGVNLNSASEEQLEALVRCGVRLIYVAIDGATQESYEAYRIGGRLENVLRHVDTINAIKRRTGSHFPVLAWQMVIMKSNAHEVKLAQAMAAERGMIFLTKLCWEPSLRAPVEGLGSNITVTYSGGERGPDAEQRLIQRIGDSMCMNLWDAPQLNFDGKILGCVYNHWGNFGRLEFGKSLLPHLEGGLIGATRRALAGEGPMPSESPCRQCQFYTDRLNTGHWLTPQRRGEIPSELRPPAPWRLFHRVEDLLRSSSWRVARSLGAEIVKRSRY
jgi:hypothetical protein